MTTSTSTSFFPDDNPTVSVRVDTTADYDSFSFSEKQTSITIFIKKKNRLNFIASLRSLANQLEGPSNAQD